TAPRARRRRPAGLVMGYALLDRPTIEEGVQRLAACVARLMPSRSAVRRRRSTPAAQGRELRRKAD
ncbi:MAG: hypothetical protein ACK4PH_28780, partial [Aquincola tertiaricarbonis]